MKYCRKLTETLTAYYSIQDNRWEVKQRIQQGRSFFNPIVAFIELPKTVTTGQLIDTLKQNKNSASRKFLRVL